MATATVRRRAGLAPAVRRAIMAAVRSVPAPGPVMAARPRARRRRTVVRSGRRARSPVVPSPAIPARRARGRPNIVPVRGRPPNFRPVHGRPFHYPSGYRYRRWSVGLILPSLFLAAPYYYDDYWGLGVGAPPPGCRWVRYGPDLLLVDVRSGRIRDVLYGVFY